VRSLMLHEESNNIIESRFFMVILIFSLLLD